MSRRWARWSAPTAKCARLFTMARHRPCAGGAWKAPYDTSPAPESCNIYSVADRDYARAFEAERFGLLVWDARHRRLQSVRRVPGTNDASYIDFDALVPIAQLAAGWFPPEGTFRWIQPHAAARLYRPPQARRFELTVNAEAPAHRGSS